MTNAACSLRVVLVLPILLSATARGDEPVAARVETTLSTHEDNIRQLAFDGVATTFFESENKATAEDHFTLVLDKPVSLTSIAVTTGRPDKSEAVTGGTLEVSPDGQTFRELARFTDGEARAAAVEESIKAIRIKPGASSGPIAIREVSIVSDPPVSIFKYPVEFVVDVSDAPDLKPWAEMVARTCERAYPMINEELASDGFTPPGSSGSSSRRTIDGVAGTSSDRIVGSVDYFREHPKDVGAMVHETVHVVQAVPPRAQAGLAGGGDQRLHPLLQVRAGKARADQPPDGPLQRQLPGLGGVPGVPRREVRQGHRPQAQRG